MSLSCETGDYGDAEWWWYPPMDEEPLATRRSRKCCSCRKKISVGETARRICRFRPPTEFEEYRGIYENDAEVAIADWYLCETCGDLAESISSLGYGYSLGDESLKQQVAETKDLT